MCKRELGDTEASLWPSGMHSKLSHTVVDPLQCTGQRGLWFETYWEPYHCSRPAACHKHGQEGDLQPRVICTQYEQL